MSVVFFGKLSDKINHAADELFAVEIGIFQQAACHPIGINVAFAFKFIVKILRQKQSGFLAVDMTRIQNIKSQYGGISSFRHLGELFVQFLGVKPSLPVFVGVNFVEF